MLPNLAVLVATLGLLAILWMIYREVREQVGPLERNSLIAGAATIVAVAVWHVVTSGGGGAH
jgi:hypothetical protein